MSVEKTMAWWRKQGVNAKCTVFRTGHAVFGDSEFVDVFWEYKGERGRDRVRKSAKGYNREFMEV